MLDGWFVARRRCPVLPESIGFFSGRLDGNGNKIYSNQRATYRQKKNVTIYCDDMFCFYIVVDGSAFGLDSIKDYLEVKQTPFIPLEGK